MDVNEESMFEGLSQSSELGQMSGNPTVDHNGHLFQCALCPRIFSSDDGPGDSQAISFCRDCKFLILEDSGTPIQGRRTQSFRRRRYRSSDSTHFFSQQVSHIITQARQNQAAFLGHDNLSIDGDSATSALQRSSSRTTPSQSRRWRRVLSDSESDVIDSIYGESETNGSFSGSRIFPGESDSISYSAYGGDSDASVDGHSFLEGENYIHPSGSDPESDTDIDPMNAGLYHWNSDDLEEDDEDDGENSEWEETDAEENTFALVRGQLYRNFGSSESSINSYQRQILSPGFEDIANSFTNFEQTEVEHYVGHPRDHLGGRGIEELLAHLAETESPRRGAPPAAVSFVNKLLPIVIQEDSEKLDDLTCAICKDSLSVGTIVNQLPCLHFYHRSCILPWLSTRNTCPLCRFELPTEDQDYEERKHASGNILDAQEIQLQDVDEDGSSYTSDGGEAEMDHTRLIFEVLDNVNFLAGREGARRRWFFLAAAAAPLIGVVGIALALCFGNPMTHLRWPNSHNNLNNALGQHPSLRLDVTPSIQTNGGRNRRWWFPF